MLATQYRMNRQIMEFSNRKFYHNGLVADASVAGRVLLPGQDDPLVNSPVEFLDTAGCGFDEEMHPETLSRYNIEEANLLLAHLHRLLTHLEAVAPDAAFSVGILSPYKAQVQQLHDRFREHGFALHFPRHSFTLDTVDGFQGQERDIIYFSAVRSNPKGEIGFLGDTRRLNVAMTRARAKLVMAADSATVAQHPFFSDLVDYMQEIGAYGSAWELVSYT
jgi:superfamily I DNA and/or RNA helicase